MIDCVLFVPFLCRLSIRNKPIAAKNGKSFLRQPPPDFRAEKLCHYTVFDRSGLENLIFPKQAREIDAVCSMPYRPKRLAGICKTKSGSAFADGSLFAALPVKAAVEIKLCSFAQKH